MRVQLAAPVAAGAGVAAAAADAVGGVQGPVLRAHFVQICVVAMHQNGRDTHIRQVRLLYCCVVRGGGLLPPSREINDAICESVWGGGGEGGVEGEGRRIRSMTSGFYRWFAPQ